MAINVMSPALQAHLRKVVEAAEGGKIREKLEAEARKLLSGKEFVSEAARQLKIEKLARTTGVFRSLFAQSGQVGDLTVQDINALKNQFEALVLENSKSTIRGKERIKSEVEKSLQDTSQLSALSSQETQKLAVSLLALGGKNVRGFTSLIQGVEEIIKTSKSPDDLTKRFVSYLDKLNQETVNVFNTPDLVPNFTEWYEGIQKAGKPESTSRVVRRNKGTKAQRAEDSVAQARAVAAMNSFGIGQLMGQASTVVDEFQAYEIKFPESEHALLNLRFKEYVVNVLRKSRRVAEYISLNTDAGHVMGLFNIRLIRLFDIKTAEFKVGDKTFDPEITIDSQGPIPKITVSLNPVARGLTSDSSVNDLQNFSNILTAIFQQLSNIDFLTSSYISAQDGVKTYINLIKQNFGLLGGNTEKIKTAYAIYSIQIAWLNREAGRQLSVAGATLGNLVRDLLNANSADAELNKSFKKFAKSFKGLQKFATKIQNTIETDQLQKIVNKTMLNELNKSIDAQTKTLLESSSSNPLKVSLAKAVGALLTGTTYNPPPTKLNSSATVPVKKVTKKKIPVTKTVVTKATKQSQELQKAVASTKSLVIKIKQQAITRKIGVSLVSLQNIINGGLFEQIRKNMGTGSRRDVLNFRTGRLAESAVVQRMSESREGMITAFYTYMKNPYATFSRGGRQERPFTRDPKTLISKSIRELANPLVANRMRAVLV